MHSMSISCPVLPLCDQSTWCTHATRTLELKLVHKQFLLLWHILGVAILNSEQLIRVHCGTNSQYRYLYIILLQRLSMQWEVSEGTLTKFFLQLASPRLATDRYIIFIIIVLINFVTMFGNTINLALSGCYFMCWFTEPLPDIFLKYSKNKLVCQVHEDQFICSLVQKPSVWQ